MRVRLPFLPVIPEVKTTGGHIYSTKALKSVFDQIQRKLPIFGSLGHPIDGKTRMGEISHNLHAIERVGVSIVYGDVELLSTQQGQMALTFFGQGLPIYLATRIMASLSADGHVNDDLLVCSVDMVVPDHMPTVSMLDIIVQSIFAPDEAPPEP